MLHSFFSYTGYFFDLEAIRQDVSRAIHKFGFGTGNQIALVHPRGPVQDVHLHASSIRQWPKIWPNGIGMADFSVFNEALGDGPLCEMWTKLHKERGVRRLRIAKLEPNRCYSLHNDEEVRYHFAVETNPKSMFVISDKPRDEKNMPVYPNRFHIEWAGYGVFHVPSDGQVYMIDANHVHTAINGGDTTRIHLIFECLSDLNCRIRHG